MINITFANGYDINPNIYRFADNKILIVKCERVWHPFESSMTPSHIYNSIDSDTDRNPVTVTDEYR